MDKIKKFLQRLLDFGKKAHHLPKAQGGKPYFNLLPIKQIAKSPCSDANTLVIDFDKTKELISEKQGWQYPKSCDGLKILPEIGRIDFLEFKSWNDFIEHQLKKGERTELVIRKQLDKFDFVNKIKDSFLILESVMRSADFRLTNEERLIFNNLPKSFIILVDIDVEKDNITKYYSDLVLLSKAARTKALITKLMEETVEGLKLPMLADTPVIISCKNIDSHYANLQAEYQNRINKSKKNKK